MDTNTWKILKAAIGTISDPPAWVKELASLSEDDISRLPKYEDASNGQLTEPWIEEKTVAQDYMEFLLEQIHIDARGPEWKELLQQRLSALQPFVGKKVLTATFHRK